MIKRLTPWLLVFCTVLACNPVNRVIRDPKKTQKVVDNYLRNYPIKNDTTYIPGDTVTTLLIGYDTTVVRDTARIPGDTVTRVETRVITKTVTKTNTVRDTIRVADGKMIAAVQKTVLVKDAELEAKGKRITELEGDVRYWLWRFWLLIALIVLYIGYKLYRKFQKLTLV